MDKGVHPTEVARLFGVHLRTIFRWVRKGYLRSKMGLISIEDIDKALLLWNASVSLPMARKILNVSVGTVSHWRKKGLLMTVLVMGAERITKSSIVSLPNERQGEYLIHPGYFGIVHLIKTTGTCYKTVMAHLDDFVHEVIDGRKLIPKWEMARIKNSLKNSYTVLETSRIIGVDKSNVRKRIKEGKLKSFTFLGITRMSLNSIEEYKRDRIITARLKEEEKRREVINRNLSKIRVETEVQVKKEQEKVEKLAKRSYFNSQALVKRKALIGPSRVQNKTEPRPTTRYKVKVKPKILIPDYEPKLLVKIVMGRNCNVTTLEEASKSMGVGSGEVSQLMMAGTLRFCHEDDERFPYIASVKAWIARRREANRQI